MENTIIIRINPQLKNKIREVADSEHRSMTSLILKVMEDYVYATRDKGR